MLNSSIIVKCPAPHQAVRIELPLLVAVRTEPIARIVMPFVVKWHGDAIRVKRPHFLDETIVGLLGPLPFEKLNDGSAPLEEFGPVPPAAVIRVSERDALRITCVPGIFGHAHFLNCRLAAKGR